MNRENIATIALLSLVLAITVYHYSFKKMIWRLEDKIVFKSEGYQFEPLESIPPSASFISAETLELDIDAIKPIMEILE